MNTKHYLITGATSGIGYMALKMLASQEPNSIFIFPSRNYPSGKKVQDEIRLSSGNPSIYFIEADLANFADVRRLAEEVLNNYPKLDVLVNNAGVYMPKKKITKDGLEETYQVNYFSPFLLTYLLLDRLKESPDGRIVNVSSVGHFMCKKFNPEQLTSGKNFRGFGNYAASKLALILFTYHLSNLLKGTNVKVNALHPGGIATRIARGNPFINLMMNWLGTSPEKGAIPIIYLAQSPKAKDFTGLYFDKENPKPIPSSSLSYNEDLALETWNFTLKYLTLPLKF